MSHHGNNDVSPEMRELMGRIFGEYPNGKLNKDDAGALALSIGQENGSIVIRFPKPVAWIGFSPEEALGIAEVLVKHATAAGRHTRSR